MADLGDSLDLPFELNPPGQTIDLNNLTLAGGVVCIAAVVPIPDVGSKPGIIFRFTRPDGAFYDPICLIIDPEQALKAPILVNRAVQAAVKAVREGAS